MLHSIQIENFAIVQKLSLHLHQGLTIISGETGAGKSILIDALGLVLGERADASVVRQGSDAASVIAQFELPNVAQNWLQQQGFGDAPQCTLRRVVNPTGRSRAYINEQAVSIQTLRQLGSFLVDIHGQHAHQSLLQHEVQRQLLDALLPNSELLQQVAQAYQHWKALQTELSILGGASQDREAKLTLLRYQVQELEGLELSPETLQTLEQEHRRLANARQLLDTSQHVLELLDAEDSSACLAGLNQASRELSQVQQHDTGLNTVTSLLENAMIHAQEAVGELRHYISKLELDPQRLQQLEQRISLLQDMARKHKVRVADLPEYFQNLMTQLEALENYEQRAHVLEQALAKSGQAYYLVAEQLHNQRVATAEYLGKKISGELKRLGMPNGELRIMVSADEHAAPTLAGIDIVEFLVSTNIGYAPRPLHKVASGGELSRISLAIQVLTAQASGVPSLVFDEVDVGIGGGVAEIVGQLLRRLGEQRQVLCITHLPQVASQGHQHLQVSKHTENALSTTQIHYLKPSERIEEVARMLGGVKMTAQTLAHAEEMLLRVG